MGFGLGIDTGGTYTDSVIVDLQTGKVLSKAKALTTRDDLCVGITNSIDKLDGSLFERIRLVSVSSTLATNSVVEGKGCRVALIVAGHKFDRQIPVEEEIMVTGGHTLLGTEREELDVEAARKFIKLVNGRVDAVAISSYLSVRNPSHEILLKEMVEEESKLPVVCGHELTTKLGFQERTLTSILNAKLIPTISDLVASVKTVLKRRKIEAPIMIVKGDGSVMAEEVAKERPVETILSGPAASLTGAKFLSGEEDCIVIDIGGTTTDIGILRGGMPRLDPEGALIGGRRTRVKAADISTSGIGGDSRVIVHNGRIDITPLRVVPLCIGAALHPEILPKLEKMRKEPPQIHLSIRDPRSINMVNEFFIFSREMKGLDLGKSGQTLIDLIRKEPRTIHEISALTGMHPLEFDVRRLEELGIIQRIGLTPTDILHAEGTYVEYDPLPSKLGVEIQSAIVGMESGEFCSVVKNKVVEKVAYELLSKLVYEETGKMDLNGVAEDFIMKFIKGTPGLDYLCRLDINKKIIGIGAPVGAYLPEVARRFDTELMLPEHTEVGNAVGAITGSVVEKVEILIRPKPGMSIEEDPACFLHSQHEMREFDSMSDAIKYAEKVGKQWVMEQAKRAGASEIELVVERNDMRAKVGEDWGDDILIESKINIIGIGKPTQFFEGRV